MKKISAILIAFLLCASVTQVSAQEIKVMDMVTTSEPYLVAPTDSWVVFVNPPTISHPPTSCALPDPTLPANKGRIIHIINRRGNSVTVTNLTLSITANSIVIPFRQAIEVMCDGRLWFLLNKSTF